MSNKELKKLSESDIKACPLCKGAATIVIPRGHYFPFYIAKCTECGLQTNRYPTPEEAAAAWNKRPEEELEILKGIENFENEMKASGYSDDDVNEIIKKATDISKSILIDIRNI